MAGEDASEPLLVARRRPAAVDDEQPVQLGRHQRVDEVGCLAFAQPGPQRFDAGERSCDRALAVVSLALVVGQQFGGGRIRARCARQDAVDVAAPHVDGHGDAGEPGEEPVGFLFGEEGGHFGPLGHRDRLVVAGDGDVEQRLEDPELRREQAVHGRSGDIGPVADGVDGRRRVAALGEEDPGRVDHGSTGEPGAGLTSPLVGRIPLDDRHDADIITLELRVKLSIWVGHRARRERPSFKE